MSMVRLGWQPCSPWLVSSSRPWLGTVSALMRSLWIMLALSYGLTLAAAVVRHPYRPGAAN